MLHNNFSNLYKATIISLFTAIIITGFSIILGKENLFLILNHDYGKLGDWLFNYATYLGDGVVWGILVILGFLKNKKWLIPIVLSIIISTIIVHVIKGHVIIPNYRPIEVFNSMLRQVHTIQGVEVHFGGSFPSGHSTQAFTMYLLLCVLIKRNWIIWVGYFLALIVGYSRVYQAQHFPIDVAGGIFVAIVTVYVSLWVSKKISLSFLD